MSQIRFDTIQQLHSLIGKEIAVSDWTVITQERIDLFAGATGDRQWIHVDAVRAAQESPFKTTIAHGFLILSLLVQLLSESLKIANVRMAVNYGLNKLRFTEAVPVGTRVRARFELHGLENASDGGVQVSWNVTMEHEGSVKPCLVAEWLIRYYT